jgi:hypothetical protein
MSATNGSRGPSEIKDVLIVSYWFTPVNSVAARRFGEMATYMEEFGWRTWVITTNSSGSLPVRLSPSRIFRVGKNLQEETYSDHKKILAQMSRRLRILRGLLRRHNVWFYSVDSTLKWYKQVVSEYAKIRKVLPKVDVVIGSYGPPAALWLARYFSRQYHVPWIADFRDLGALRPDARNTLAKSLDCAIERLLLKSAKMITTVSPTLSKILGETYRKPTSVIYNGWDCVHQTGDRQIPITERTSFEQPYLYYAGRFYEHQMKGFFVLLEVMARKPEFKLLIRSLGPLELEEQVRTKIAALGIRDRVDILPPCDAEQVHFEAERALANLIVEDIDEDNIFSRGTLTGKLLQLVASSPPVLAIARRDSDIKDVLKITEKGQLCSSSAEVHNFVEKLQNESKIFSGNPDKITQFSKKRQAEKFCQILNQTIADIE